MIWPDGDPSESLMDHLYQVTIRVAKSHGYDGYIRVKIFRGWGKKSEKTHNMTKLGLF